MQKLIICLAITVFCGGFAAVFIAYKPAEPNSPAPQITGKIAYEMAKPGGPPQYVDLPMTYSPPPKYSSIADLINKIEATEEKQPPVIRMLFAGVGEPEPHDTASNIEFLERLAKPADFKRAYEDEETLCLAENLYFEAGKEPLAGIVAVANATLNRRDSPDFPNTVCEVVHQCSADYCEFSWARNRNEDGKEAGRWSLARDIATYAMLGEFADYNPDNTMMWFHRNQGSAGSWHDKTLEDIGQILNHRFYAAKPE